MEDITTPEAGAEPEIQSAETVGNQGEEVSGTDTQTADADQQADQADTTSTGQEGENATEGKKQPHQTTLEERVQQLAEKRIAEMEAKLNAKLEAVTQSKVEEKPNFIEIDYDKVNEHFRDTLDKIEELKLDGKYLEAAELQEGLTDLRSQIRQNESAKAEFVKRMSERNQTEQHIAAVNQRIAEASELVRKENGLTPEVWKAGEEFFIAERQSKPLLDAQYREKVMLQGPVAALLWAKEYVEKNMGKKEQELIDRKEAAKTSLPPGKTSTVPPATGANLVALRDKARSGNAEDLAAYMAAKKAAA